MNKISAILVSLSLIAVFGLSSCSSDYHKMVDKELASGVKNDSLFLGLEFGMTSKDFYAQCWDLNKRELVVQGSANSTVKYDLPGLKQPATMDFYPDFHNDQIFQMPVTIAYKAWAPWNKSLSSDSLQLDVLSLFEQWYGGGFLRVESPERGIAYVKVDGNRRITIFKADELDIHVLFTDLVVEGELKKLKK